MQMSPGAARTVDSVPAFKVADTNVDTPDEAGSQDLST